MRQHRLRFRDKNHRIEKSGERQNFSGELENNAALFGYYAALLDQQLATPCGTP
jgi:hypothetical protein